MYAHTFKGAINGQHSERIIIHECYYRSVHSDYGLQTTVLAVLWLHGKSIFDTEHVLCVQHRGKYLAHS